MLAQNFKSAADLGVTEPQLDALRKTLVLLETGKLKHVPYETIVPVMPRASEQPAFSGLFNMAFSAANTDCGTIACIKGTAELIGGFKFEVFLLPDELHKLFYQWAQSDPSTEQAATALRSYLTTGDARWDLAVS